MSPRTRSTRPSSENWRAWPKEARLRFLAKLRALTALQELRSDPGLLMRAAGKPPDPWQTQVLRSTCQQMILCCNRQAGKSTTVAALALLTAVLEPPATVLILSPTQRQSSELFHKVKEFYHAHGGHKAVRPAPWGRPRSVPDLDREELLAAETAERETALQLELTNGSRVVSLPGGNPDTVVAFSSIRLLVIDEAARAKDDLYFAVRPMLNRSGGRLVLLSTPKGRRGFFFDEWENGRADEWQKVLVRAPDCPWLTPAILTREERSMGPYWYRQEYMCSFNENVGALFREEDIQAMFCDAPPRFPEGG